MLKCRENDRKCDGHIFRTRTNILHMVSTSLIETSVILIVMASVGR